MNNINFFAHRLKKIGDEALKGSVVPKFEC